MYFFIAPSSSILLTESLELMKDFVLWGKTSSSVSQRNRTAVIRSSPCRISSPPLIPNTSMLFGLISWMLPIPGLLLCCPCTAFYLSGVDSHLLPSPYQSSPFLLTTFHDHEVPYNVKIVNNGLFINFLRSVWKHSSREEAIIHPPLGHLPYPSYCYKILLFPILYVHYKFCKLL